MATTAQDWKESENDMNRLQQEPVITYDHKSDPSHPHYFRTGNRVMAITITGLVIESILITGMMTALILLSW